MTKLKITKLKTKRSAAKRFKLTAGGIKFNHAGHNHILTTKNSKRKSRLCVMGVVNDSDVKNMARLLLAKCPAKMKKIKKRKTEIVGQTTEVK